MIWDEPLKYWFMNIYKSLQCSNMYHNIPKTMIENYTEFSNFGQKYIERKFKHFEPDYLFDEEFINEKLFIPTDEIVKKLEKCYNNYKKNKNLINIIKLEIPEVKYLKSKYIKSIIFKNSNSNKKIKHVKKKRKSKSKIQEVPKFTITDKKIILNCGVEILFKDLLIHGVEYYCDCHSDRDIFKALSEKFNWCIYIIQNKEYSLLEPVEYIGYTKDLCNRLYEHKKNLIYNEDKHKIRINVHLSEKTCIDIFKPIINDRATHSFNDYRIFKYGTFIEYKFLDNSEVEHYLLKYDTYDDNITNNFCYDSRYKNCIHKPNCSIMKYYNMANNLIENNHIEESFRKDLNTRRKINFESVDDISNIGQVLEKRKQLKNIHRYKYFYNTMINKDLLQYLNTPNILISKILSQYSLHYLEQIIFMITTYMKCLTTCEKIQLFGINFHKLFYKYSKIYGMIMNYLKLKNSGKISHREQQNWMSVGELEQILNNLYSNYIKSGQREDYQQYIILLLYMKQNTMRGDYYNIKYKNFNTHEDNYIDMKMGLLVFNDPLKVKKKLVYKIKSNVALHLAKFTTLANTCDYLFTINKKEFPSSSKFNGYIQNFLSKELKKQGNNKSIGVQMLRKIITTDSYSQEISLEEEINLAHYMNHSVSISKYYYNKFPESLKISN